MATFPMTIRAGPSGGNSLSSAGLVGPFASQEDLTGPESQSHTRKEIELNGERSWGKQAGPVNSSKMTFVSHQLLGA